MITKNILMILMTAMSHCLWPHRLSASAHSTQIVDFHYGPDMLSVRGTVRTLSGRLIGTVSITRRDTTCGMTDWNGQVTANDCPLDIRFRGDDLTPASLQEIERQARRITGEECLQKKTSPDRPSYLPQK